MSSLDPIEITLNIIVNIASSILAHQSHRLEGTFVARALKAAGLVPPNFEDRLQSILRDSVESFFTNNLIYKRQSIVDFLKDDIISEQIANHILDSKPIDEAAILGRLQNYIRSEPETQVLVGNRQLSENKLIKDFFEAYHRTRNRHLEPGQISIIVALESVTKDLLKELVASEERLKQFIVNLLNEDSSPSLDQTFDVDQQTYIRLLNLERDIDEAIEATESGYLAIVGPPGSGKSTSITQYTKRYEIRHKQPVIRYYCFTSLMDPASHRRLSKHEFLDSLIQQLQLASRSISVDIANEAQAIKLVGYYNNEEKRFSLVLENLKSFLMQLSVQLEEIDQKLLIVIDGIDHVARSKGNESNTLLSALPYPLPKQIVCLVGTQSVQYLPPSIQRDCQSNAVIEVPRFSELQIRKYVSKFSTLHHLIDKSQLREINSLTQGVPLYLRYVMTHVRLATSTEQISEHLSNMPHYDTSIGTYYWRLWSTLSNTNNEQVEMRICELLARSPFPIGKKHLAQILKVDIDKLLRSLSQVDFLLLYDDRGYRIFHESFRAFIDQELDDLVKQKLDKQLFNYLNIPELKDLWYRHSFRFALQVEDYEYIVKHANTDLIEKSIADGRSQYELIGNLRIATDAARKMNSPQALARIGALVAHTTNRFEYHLNSHELFTCLIAVNAVDQALELIAPDGILQETTVEIADSIVSLALDGYGNEAQNLADQFFDRLPREIKTIDVLKSITKLLTIFSESPADRLSLWIDAHRDHEGFSGQYSSTGCDLLRSVLSLIYQFKRFDLKRSLKRLLLSGDNKVFWQSKWYLYIAFFEAEREPKDALYHVYTASKYVIDKSDRMSLAGLSANLGAECEFIEMLLKDIVELPPTDNQAISYFDGTKHFTRFRSYIRALIGSNKRDEIEAIRQYLQASDTWMAFYHLSSIDLVINDTKPNLSSEEILEPLEQLYSHKKLENERIYEVFNVIKQDIPQFVQMLVNTYLDHFSDLDPLVLTVKHLNDLEVLNTHFGIGLTVIDYTLEIECLTAFGSYHQTHQYLKPLLLDVHDRIRKDTLETETRARSLLQLAKLCATLGYRQIAVDLLGQARIAARGYGYRKDSTIRILLDATKIVNRHDPKHASLRLADIGGWIRWLPRITDGKGTKWFNHIHFEAILDYDFNLAVETLGTYYKYIARWKFYDCISLLIQRYQGTSYKLAYILSELVNEWDDDGFRDKFDTRMYLLDHVIAHGQKDDQTWIVNQLKQFILTEVDPRQRKQFANEFNTKAKEFGLSTISSYSDSTEQDSNSQPVQKQQKLIKINEEEIEISEYMAGISNITDFELLLESIQKANVFGFREELESIFRELLAKSLKISEIDNLFDRYSKHRALDAEEHKAIALAYARVGSHEKSLHHYGEAFRTYHSWGLFDKDIKYLQPLIENDTSKALDFILEVTETSIQKVPYAGFGVATLLIRVLDRFGSEYRDAIIDIYDAFHEHVGSIFSDLPNLFEEDIYTWMRLPSSTGTSFDKQAVDLIMSEWGEPMLNRRLYFTHHMPDLVIDNPELWLPTIVEKLQDENYTLRCQAATVLHAVALRDLSLLSEHTSQIVAAIDQPHIEISQHLLSILSQLADESNELVDYLDAFYPVIHHRSIFMPELSPSQLYQDTVLGRASISIKKMIADVCQLIEIDEDTLHWKIEQRLESIGYDQETANHEHRSRWKRYSKGTLGDFIEFESYASYFLYHTFAILIDEQIRTKPFSLNTLEALYKRVSIYDPYLPLKHIKVKPQNISIPNFNLHRHSPEITDEIYTWLNFGEIERDITYNSLSGQWMIIGHIGSISRQWLHESRHVFSCLIHRSFAEEIKSGNQKPGALQAVMILAPQPPHYTLTWAEARNYIDWSSFSGQLTGLQYIPLIAIHTNNWWYYKKHQVILGLAGKWISEWDLSWSNQNSLDMHHQGNQVISHNYWCDGYFTGPYEHSCSGTGTELLISTEFLNQLMLKYKLCLLTSITTTRSAYSPNKIDNEVKKTLFSIAFPKK